MNNILIIGSSSKIANSITNNSQNHSENIYGLTSNVNHNGYSTSKIKSFHYSDYLKIAHIRFNKIFILSTRPANRNGTFADYSNVNEMILKILQDITFSNTSKIVFFSSLSVYDSQEELININTPVKPQTNYGKAKFQLEKKLTNFAKNRYSLMILRLPVLLYKGVETNFLGLQMKNMTLKKSLIFYNPKLKISAIFDVKTLIELEKKANNTFEILICGSQPDLTFLEIAEEFKKFGANKIIWMKSQNPSTMIDVSPLENILNYKPSASYIFKNWMKSEFS